MPNSILLQPKGLYSYYNHLDQQTTPQGGLLVATNAVIDRNSILNSRRGYKIYGNAMDSTIADTAHQLLNYKKRLLRHWGIGSGHFLDWDDGAGNFTTFNFDLTGTLNSNTSITNFTTTSNLQLGMFVSGAGIPANTIITEIPTNTSIVISNPATASGSITISFTYDIEELSEGIRIKSIEANGNFYFTTSNGIKKISIADATGLSTAFITQAGVPAALDTTATLGTSGVGFLNGQSSCAYRIVWGITDANNNTLLSAPGSRIIVNNPGTLNQNVTLNTTIPNGITTDYFYQIYRTPQISLVNTFTIIGNTNGTTTISGLVDTSSLIVGMQISGTDIPNNTTIVSVPSIDTITISNAATGVGIIGETLTVSQQLTGGSADPGDEEQLAFEGNPTNTDLTNGFVTVTDIADDSFLGAYLYTNQNSGEGILQSNYPPPLALDLTTFKNFTFYANTSDVEQINLSLLSVSDLTAGTSTLSVTQGSTVNTYTFQTQTLTATTSTSTTITDINPNTDNLIAGQSISGPNIDSGTYIVSVDSVHQITVSKPTLASMSSDPFTAGYESSSLNYIGISQFPTPGQQVSETTASIVRILNRNDSGVVFVYTPNDAPTDVPGQMLFKSRNLSDASFFFTVDDASTTGTQFNPALTTTAQTNATSTNNVYPNRVWYSKEQQPDAVPIVNFFDVGPKDKGISRILALRDNLFILKEEGVYRLTGTDPTNFTIFPFDFSTIIEASDSAVVLNNLIYMFSNQGIATVSDTGVAIISRPIEGQLLPLLTRQYVDFSTATFGVTYETDRSYYLYTVTDPTDTFATQCFRYNTFTQTWTVLDVSKRCGLVNVNDDLLYLGPTDINFLEQERKNFDRTDYADREYEIELDVDSVNGTTITLPSLENVFPNDVVVQTQYLSLKQFNRILTKFDNDAKLSPHNYVSTLTADPGVNLSDQLDLLLAKIATDPGRIAAGGTAGTSYTALEGTGSGSFIDLQTCFNNMVVLLNNDVGVGYHNYTPSSGTVNYEFYIVSTIKNLNQIVSLYSYSLIAGPITVYQFIPVTIQFIPQSLGDVSATKHISEGTYIFEDASFTGATASYSTDLSGNFEDTPIIGFGNGIFGNTVFGEGVFGGNGSGVPFRTYIPRNKQRARYINCKFEHNIAREIFYLYGLSLQFNPMSQRGYR